MVHFPGPSIAERLLLSTLFHQQVTYFTRNWPQNPTRFAFFQYLKKFLCDMFVDFVSFTALNKGNNKSPKERRMSAFYFKIKVLRYTASSKMAKF